MPTRDDDLDSDPAVSLPSLPPIDDDEEGKPSIAGIDEESSPDDLDGDDADRDDTSADDLPLDADDDFDDDPLGNDDGGFDVGEDGDDLDLTDEHEGVAIETSAFDDGDDELEEDDSPTALDDGAEGTSEPIEETVDEAALPDMDDDRAPDESDLAREILVELDPPLAPWAAARLAAIDGAGASFPCSTVVARNGVVVAAGQRLLVVDEGGLLARVASLSDTVVAVTMAEGEAIGVTDRGEAVTLPLDAGTTGTRVGARRVLSSTAGLPVSVAAVSGRLWAVEPGKRSATLESISLPLGAREDTRLVRDRGVVGIAASANTLVAVTTGDEGPAIERFRGDLERMTRPTGALRTAIKAERGALLVAAADGGESIALARAGHVAVSRDGGASSIGRELEDVVAVAFQGEGADAALLVLVAPGLEAEAGERGELRDQRAEAARPGVLLTWPRGGELARLAELSIDPKRGAGLAWDASRDVVWVATATGLVALGAPTRH